MDTYCEAWPSELKETERKRFRAECKLRCLTAALERIAPEDFDALMRQIEQVQEELRQTSDRKLGMVIEWNTRQYQNQTTTE